MEKYFKEYILNEECRHDYKSLFTCINRFEKELILLDFEFLGKRGSDFNFPEYEELVLKNKSGLTLEWNTWFALVADTVQIINLLIAKPLTSVNEVDYDDLKGTTSFFIECVDGYNWSVGTDNERLFDALNIYFTNTITAR